MLFIICACSTNTTDQNGDTGEDTEGLNDTGATYTALCDDYATAILGDVGKISNNVWGYESASFTSYSQCVFYDTEHLGIFGWEWHLQGKSDYPSYPRISWGWNPWDKESSGTEVLPCPINALSTLIVSFEKKLQVDGLYNTAFDIWLTSPNEVYSNTIVGEIMIWLDATQPQSATLTADNIPIGSQTYDFYKNTSWNDFPYLVFVQKSDDWNGQIDLMPFISYLVKNDHLAADANIAEVEFGNEIWSGSGKMIVSNFSVSAEYTFPAQQSQ